MHIYFYGVCVIGLHPSYKSYWEFITGAAARPGKVVGSVLRYDSCSAAAAGTADPIEQRRMMRHPAGQAQYSSSTVCMYPRRSAVSVCKNERGEGEVLEGVPNRIQPRAQYVQRKVAAAHGGSGSHWF